MVTPTFYTYRVNAGTVDRDKKKIFKIKAFNSLAQAINCFDDLKRKYAYVEVVDIDTNEVITHAP